MNRTKRSPEQGKALVQDFRDSGLTQEQFAEKHNVSVPTLQRWLRRAGDGTAGDEAQPKMKFVEVLRRRGRQAVRGPGVGPVASLTIELPQGSYIRFDALPPVEYLARLFAVEGRHSRWS